MSVLTDKMFDYNLRAGEPLSAPIMAAAVIIGTPGSTSYEYCASFKTLVGETLPSTSVTVSNGPATLNGVNYIRLAVESVPAAARYILFFKKVAGIWKLLGETTAAVNLMEDKGQAVQEVNPASTNTSGRREWRALLFHSGKVLQRAELMDLQAICLRGTKELGDTIHKGGDIITGCAEQFVSGTTWKFTEGVIYLEGQHVYVPEGQLTLVGTGVEKVGLRCVPVVRTHNDDTVQRNVDEGVDLQYAGDGADRLVYQLTWVVDEAGQIDIREFTDGQPTTRVFRTERSEMEKMIAQRVYDTSGDFVVKPFPRKMRAHATDTSKCLLEISGGGRAYVGGNLVETIAPQFPEIPKARDTKSRNGAALESFDIPGGSVLGTVAENFDVDGKALKLKIGSGNSHTVTLSGSGQTAVQVATQIAASVNAYPTTGTLVTCVGASGHVQITAADGKNLVVEAIANDAYSLLGIQTGTYTPTGQRIYQLNDSFVKNVTDFTYITEVVEAVTHDGTDHIDPLGNVNVQDLIGASNAVADCHDNKFDYIDGVDFVRQGNNISFAGMGGSYPGNGATYYVKYRYVINATKAVRIRVRVVDAQIVKGAEDGQDTIVVTGATSIIEVKSGNPVAGLSGAVKDVIRILRVNNSPGQSQTHYDAYALLKNSTALIHNNSQIDWSAAGAQGVTPGGQPTTAATYYVTFEFWWHSVEGAFVVADSYLNDYEEIEYAPSPATWLLRDCVDFRTLSTALPVDGDAPRGDYEFYLKRVDKIVLKADGYFQRIAGEPAEVPEAPRAPEGPLPIFQLTIPPYTYQPDDVEIVSLAVQRITQRGLNEIQADMQRQKYLNAVNLLASTAVANPAALDAKGIFTDPLTGQGRADVAFDKNGVTFTAAIDPTNRVVRLPVAEDGRAIRIDELASTGIQRVGRVLVFEHQPKVFFSQLKASFVRNCNPYQVYGWVGALELDPTEDFWTDLVQLPDVDLNWGNELAALQQIEAENAVRARQITWGAWRLLYEVGTSGWGARNLNEAMGTHWFEQQQAGRALMGAKERLGSYKSLVPERTLVDLGDRVIDQTVVPYMRTELSPGVPFEIGLDMHGLLPITDIACTIDGVLVDLTPTGTTVAGVDYNGKHTVKTNGAGHATAKFSMPTGVRAGQKAIKVFKAGADPDATYAIATFTSAGMRETRQREWQGIISVVERDAVVSQQAFLYTDPLAYTFAVETGIKWISGVKLRFQSKDAALPITIEIRETLNGYPTRRVLQSKTVYPADIAVSDDATAVTTVYFQNLVGYGPGEYSVHLICNCQTYHVWCAKLGQVDILTGEMIRQNPAGGVIFESPNDSTWNANLDEDLTIEIMEANFENNAQIVFNSISGIQANMLCAAVTQLLPQGCSIQWFYRINASDEWQPFAVGIDTELGAIATQIQLRANVTGTGSTFQISEDGAGIILLLNEESADYITHNAIIEDNMNKVTMIVPLAVDGVNGAGVRTITPYYSVDDGKTWVEMEVPAGYVPVSIGNGVFREYKFETPVEGTITGATNASPIAISSTGLKFKENAIVDITGVVGNTNANGLRRLKNVSGDTAELYDPDTGAAIAGNGAYVSGGTATLADFTQYRFRLHLATSNRAVSPAVGPIQAFAA